jgi:urease accessory protein
VRAFQTASGESLVHLHNVSGGILSGDQLDLSATLSPGSRVQITTTGATRLYRRRAGAREARSAARFQVGSQSLLEFLPDPLIPYAGSCFAQETTIDLAPGATLLWWETLAPGREASGEVFQFEQLRITAEIRSHGVPIAIDRVLLDPRRRPLESAARLANCRYLGTLYVCRAEEPADTWRRLEQCLHSLACRFMATQDGVRWGISSLIRDGVVVRGISPRGSAVIGALREFWQAARLLLTGEPASLPRKVY